MTIQQIMREVQRMVGDTAGSVVSKEFLLQCINEEAQRVAARFPNTQRVSFTPSSSGCSFLLEDVLGEGVNMKIKRVFIDGGEVTMVPAAEIERLVENES